MHRIAGLPTNMYRHFLETREGNFHGHSEIWSDIYHRTSSLDKLQRILGTKKPPVHTTDIKLRHDNAAPHDENWPDGMHRVYRVSESNVPNLNSRLKKSISDTLAILFKIGC
ncbi:hypothetical protein AVEN_81337-1 [Araneus ventricosus]|uniref:Uncharacterized protein n=1 Tax=Araneus ventricosus TaxID=182803 RepID=A0A4Y2B684_ARAVE|nr:hypothetical protein AVEN_81337-1 [Araneus ventricosus]